MKLRLTDKAFVYEIIFVFLLAPAYVPAISVSPEGFSEAGVHVCNAQECQAMAEVIKKQMGPKNPCEDFHNYVCGNWEGDLEINTTYLKKKAVITLADLLGNASASTTTSLYATDKLINAYQSCTKHGRENKTLTMSIQRVLMQYNLTEWPIIENNGPKPSLSPSSDYMAVLNKTGPRPVFSYSVSVGNSDPVILMTKPIEFYVFEDDNTPLPDSRSDVPTSDKEDQPETTTYDYKDYDELLKEEEEYYKTFIRKTIRLLRENISEEAATKIVENIVRIEKGFAKLANKANNTEERLNISQLNTFVGDGLSMAPILQRDFEGLDININEETEVVIRYKDYYKNAVNFMKCTTKTDLANYILWTKIRKMAEAEGTLLNDIYKEFKRNTSITNLTLLEESSDKESADETAKLRLQCMRQLLESGAMYTAGAHYYAMAKFNETAKNDVLKIMEFVNASFMHVVKDNNWMSETTKKAAINRLLTMNAVIGYPDWMLNETIINDVYRFVPDIEENASFTEHFHFLLENNHKQTLLKLKKGAYFDKVNEADTLRSHAYYGDSSNTLVYPAASLVTHYRSPPIPRSLNYGTIGTILAQLFVTSIERYSEKSPLTGKYKKDNWDNTTRDQFCNRSSCLDNTEECNDTIGKKSDKHEKLRDYLGLRISYQAMKNSTKNYTSPFLLPDTDKFGSEDKIFFTLFGSLYCPYSVNKKPQKKVEARSADEPNFHDSLNEIVYTYSEFNKTFSCNLTEGADSCDLMPQEKPAPHC